MAMLVTAGFISGAGLVTRRVRYSSCSGRCITFKGTRIRGHRQLLEQQAKERDERDPGTVAAATKRHG